ncbi:MAG: DUF5050 domain-containing protein [Calditrichaeota bacterium]|nr:MAG: DUF5050 domain-containing protein [Calditrichota bacterium]MBL1205350.1 DUF5050 domain-containing protein [Calditrichota bacterium]NOG45179.1 DUF5050 domain-containing protein [Calditrichota bacterium]
MYRLLISFITVFFLVSCENQNPVDNDSSNSKGELSFSIDMTQAPNEVVKLRGALSRSDHDTIFFDFEMNDSAAVAKVDDLIAGIWLLSVEALNEENQIIYNGSTEVSVLSSQTTTVYLHLEPTTGTLKVIVTWGDKDLKQQILFVGQHHTAQTIYDEWRVLSMYIDGTGFKEITAGTYPIWTTDRSFFIFRYDINSIARFDFVANKAEIIGSTPNHVNFFRYMESTNRIVCDYKKDNGYWDIGHMNIDGSDFQKIVEDESTKKRPVPKPFSDWIYYSGNITGNFQIYKVKIDGTMNEQVTFGLTNASFPSFNKDGSKLLFSEKLENEYALKIIDLDSNSITTFDFSSIGEAIYPIFSEDDNYIIYVQVVGPTYFDREVFRMKSDGTEKTQITFTDQFKDYVRPVSW